MWLWSLQKLKCQIPLHTSIDSEVKGSASDGDGFPPRKEKGKRRKTLRAFTVCSSHTLLGTWHYRGSFAQSTGEETEARGETDMLKLVKCSHWALDPAPRLFQLSPFLPSSGPFKMVLGRGLRSDPAGPSSPISQHPLGSRSHPISAALKSADRPGRIIAHINQAALSTEHL